MNDPIISRFAEACGATGPLDLQVDLIDGGVLARGTVAMPFTLVGRDDACDVTLTDAEVNPRHSWLQVIGGRVFAIDLGSRTGLRWPDGGRGSGWLEVGHSVRIGPFSLILRSPVSLRPVPFPRGYNPLQSDPDVFTTRPTTVLEFRNGRRARDRWTVNRLVTIIGRTPECKINLTADDIAAYHCGLVLTPAGLWVVDLSGRGVVVNGERMRVSPLSPGAELWVGRFLIGVQYPGVAHTPPIGRPGLLTPPTPLPGLPASQPDRPPEGESTATARGPAGRPAGPPHPSPAAPPQSSPAAQPHPHPHPPPPEDEVPLGAVPPSEVGNGLPSSHILADAFHTQADPAVSGPGSYPLVVSGSGPTPPSIPAATARVSAPHDTPAATAEHLFPPPPGTAPRLTADSPAEVVLPLLRQLGELHAQMFNLFQQSMVLMVQLFGRLQREELPTVQQELARIQELNAELTRLQGEVARRAAEASAPVTLLTAVRPSTGRPAATNNSADTQGLHDWVVDRIKTLQQERQARWQSLVGLFAGKSA